MQLRFELKYLTNEGRNDGMKEGSEGMKELSEGSEGMKEWLQWRCNLMNNWLIIFFIF